ncbi:MAG: hypothetical protein JW741_12690 [Sedimentisphaerales bacterium]|nr:hypothetical protein [Sedimentisphaerales bacterium]
MLSIYLKTIGVLILAAAGAVVGLRAGRWKKPWWLVAYIVPLTLILAIVLAAVRYRFLIDHFVAVLRVTESEVVIGDPLVGREVLSYDEFSNRWRRYGVVLSRPRYPRDPNHHVRRPGHRSRPDEKQMCCLQ